MKPTNKVQLIFFNITFIIALMSIVSCKKYLDAKPDKSLVTPNSFADLQALLDNGGRINLGNYTSLSEVAADDYWVPYNVLITRSDYLQKNYFWEDANSTLPLDDYFYGPVSICNTVLDALPDIQSKANDPIMANRIKGTALFLRAFSFYYFSQIYCKPYDINGSNLDPGIPIRLTSNFNIPTTRGTVQQTYDQIILDFKLASTLLPNVSDFKTRPTKVAALSALARTYLMMEDYSKAFLYADSALMFYNSLIDYNSLSSSPAVPFSKFNEETIFYAYSGSGSILSPSRANIDSLLYKSYHTNDIRKTIFFQSKGNNTYGFKGSYVGISGVPFFTGYATDELYLIRAECSARLENKDAAINDLNTLLIKRWKTGTFIPYTAVSAEDALFQIIKERRKQLIMRGVRWSDLRRLNKDPRFAITLKRILVNGSNVMTYTLPPNDPRYVLLLPSDVISLTGLTQNPR